MPMYSWSFHESPLAHSKTSVGYDSSPKEGDASPKRNSIHYEESMLMIKRNIRPKIYNAHRRVSFHHPTSGGRVIHIDM